MRSLLVGPVLLALTGCKDFFGCDHIAKWGIVAKVVDATTALGVTGAVAVARDGAFVDTLLALSPPASATHAGATERSGRYRLDVIAPGYQLWSREGIRVREDGCHVETVRLTVSLTPQ
jgi:hypothetical protein